jgi:hypothetical protein
MMQNFEFTPVMLLGLVSCGLVSLLVIALLVVAIALRGQPTQEQGLEAVLNALVRITELIAGVLARRADADDTNKNPPP